MGINYLHSNKPKHRKFKWILYSLISVVFILILFVFILYNQIESAKTNGFSDTKQIVLDETDIDIIDEIERFHGEEAYHVVYGHSKEDQDDPIMAFVPLSDKKNKVLTINQANIISKEDITSEWSKECNDCDMVKLTPGVIDNDFVWELTYIDHKNRYVFDYVSLDKGEPYESLKFKRLFK